MAGRPYSNSRNRNHPAGVPRRISGPAAETRLAAESQSPPPSAETPPRHRLSRVRPRTRSPSSRASQNIARTQTACKAQRASAGEGSTSPPGSSPSPPTSGTRYCRCETSQSCDARDGPCPSQPPPRRHPPESQSCAAAPTRHSERICSARSAKHSRPRCRPGSSTRQCRPRAPRQTGRVRRNPGPSCAAVAREGT